MTGGEFDPDDDPILNKIIDSVTAATKPTAPNVINMADLFFKEFPPIRWIIEGLLPEGLAILSGPPKIGKSWLVMNLSIARATGGYALGKFKVERGEVLLLSLEDNERRLQSRMKICLDGTFSDISKFTSTTTWKRLDQGGLADLATWLEQHPDCKLVIIDTIQKIKPHPKRSSGNAYENDYDAYGGLQRLALKFCCCILVIHHNRKSDSKNSDDPLEAISGSTGITGAMDTILMLTRPRGEKGAILTATGRDIAEAEYGLTFDGKVGTWTVSGQPAELSLGDNAHSVIEVLKRYGIKMTAKEVHERLPDLSFDTVQKALQRIAKKNIARNDRGKYSYAGIVSIVSMNDATTHDDYTKDMDTLNPIVSTCPGSPPTMDTMDTIDTITPIDTIDTYMGGVDREDEYLNSLMAGL